MDEESRLLFDTTNTLYNISSHVKMKPTRFLTHPSHNEPQFLPRSNLFYTRRKSEYSQVIVLVIYLESGTAFEVFNVRRNIVHTLLLHKWPFAFKVFGGAARPDCALSSFAARSFES